MRPMHLTHAIEGGILTVTLDGGRLNEIGLPMLCALEGVVPLLSRPDVRALVIASAKPGGFSAGADLRELHAGLTSVDGAPEALGAHARALFDTPRTAARAGASTLRAALRRRDPHPLRAAKAWGVRAFLDRVHAAFDAIDAAPVPTIAAVHGVCFGGGFELALACDVIVADKTARFAFPELRLGLIPGFGGIPRLERDLGNSVARDLLFSGRSLSAKRAHELGLVAQLVAEGRAPDVARRLAEQTTRLDPHTLAVAKAFAKPIPRARLREEKDRFVELLGRPAVVEALTRFVEAEDAMPYLPPKDARPAPRGVS
ncbi:MAG: enoyl-CoA hydratase/isomerase family protein [Sandaracinaceae bacterium]|nr:enoyl-CoA hydratase/isomerase family protein [Sandaracinaceae bacterium]